MSRVCPYCLEPIPFSDRKAIQCPRCNRDLTGTSGTAVRPIDVRYQDVSAQLEVNFERMMKQGAAVVLCALVIAQFVHIVLPIILIGHMIAARWLLVREPRRLMGLKRRFFTRWITRLCFIAVGIPGYVAAATPVIGVLIGIGTYLGLTAIVNAYTARNLTRERDRKPLAGWEWALLITMAIVAIIVLITVAVLIATFVFVGTLLYKHHAEIWSAIVSVWSSIVDWFRAAWT